MFALKSTVTALQARVQELEAQLTELRETDALKDNLIAAQKRLITSNENVAAAERDFRSNVDNMIRAQAR